MFPHNNEGRNQLLNDYDATELQAIADSNCESGVCSKHIYYADTLSFFDKYEGEILDLIHIRYGADTLVEIFKRYDADYDAYKNDCVWLFIENVACDFIIEMEEINESEDRLIESYMKPVTNKSDYTLPDELAETATNLMNLSVFNPPRSLTLNRYSHS